MPGAALAGGTLLLGLFRLAGCPLPAPAPPSAPLQARTVQVPPSPLERGEAIFLRSCAGRHGEEGRGDGPASACLFPKPRDFSRGPSISPPFEWARPATSIPGPVVARIRAVFPDRTSDRGACRECVDRYAVAPTRTALVPSGP